MSVITPDTGAYLILGLIVTSVVAVGYVLSLLGRFRSAQQDEITLRELQS